MKKLVEGIIKGDPQVIANAKERGVKEDIRYIEAHPTNDSMESLADIALYSPIEKVRGEAIEALKRLRESQWEKTGTKRRWKYCDINELKYGGFRKGNTEKDIEVRERAIDVLERINDLNMLLAIIQDIGNFSRSEKEKACEAACNVVDRATEMNDKEALLKGEYIDYFFQQESFSLPVKLEKKLVRAYKKLGCPSRKEVLRRAKIDMWNAQVYLDVAKIKILIKKEYDLENLFTVIEEITKGDLESKKKELFEVYKKLREIAAKTPEGKLVEQELWEIGFDFEIAK